MSKILVTGATGQLGAAVTENLLKRTDAANISILVRDADKAAAFKAKGVTVAIGDYSDYAAVLAALQGIDKLYLVSGTDLENRGAQHENVIKAAKEAGVKQVLYTSFQRKKNISHSAIAVVSESHLQTERILKESGLIYTILQHGLYADIIPAFAGDQLLQTKTIYLPSGTGKVSFAVRADLAEAEATILLDQTNKFDNKELEFTGNEVVSWEEIAKMISGITGETISYVSPSTDEFKGALTQAGVPLEIVGMLGDFNSGIAAGEFEEIKPDLEAILGRKPATVKSYLQSVYGK